MPKVTTLAQTGLIPYNTASKQGTADECENDQVQPGPGQVVWHFQAVQVTDFASQGLHAEFVTAGVREDPNFTKDNQSTIGWWVRTGYDTLKGGTDTWTDAVADRLNLSHICVGPEPTGDLKVKKVVDGATSGLPEDFSRSFEVKTTCTDDGNSPYHVTLTWPDDASQVIYDIPAGSTCTASDESVTNPDLPPGYSWTTRTTAIQRRSCPAIPSRSW